MTLPRPLPSKKDVTLMLLQESDVFIHLDPRKDRVVIPLHFKDRPHLILQVGLNMPVAIPDLDVGDEGITCTLSFSRKPFCCRLPWLAIYALVSKDGRGMVWPDDVPPEVALQFVNAGGTSALEPAKAPAVREAAPPKSRKPRSRRAGAAATRRERRRPAESPARPEKVATAAQQTPGGTPCKSKRELPPYLRVIK